VLYRKVKGNSVAGSGISANDRGSQSGLLPQDGLLLISKLGANGPRAAGAMDCLVALTQNQYGYQQLRHSRFRQPRERLPLYVDTTFSPHHYKRRQGEVRCIMLHKSSSSQPASSMSGAKFPKIAW